MARMETPGWLDSFYDVMPGDRPTVALPADRRLVDHLLEQVAFLEDACQKVDEGEPSYIQRIALHARILVHDTNASSSLLNQLGVKTSLRFIEDAFLSKNAVSGRMIGPGLAVARMDGITMDYIPRYAFTTENTIVSFETWWLAPRVFMSDFHPSRKNLTLWVANKSGGAHIAEKLPRAFQNLQTGEGQNMYFGDEGSHQPSPMVPFLRQIGEELRLTLRGELRDILG